MGGIIKIKKGNLKIMKSKKLLSMFLIGGMILSNVLPVYADITNGEVLEYSNIETDISSDSELNSYNQDTLVYYQSTESFSVKIPKKINLDGTQKNPQTSFNISVSGDIGGTSSILVSSDEDFYLKQDGKADVLATVGYQRTFTSAEVIANTTDTSGLVSIPSEDGNALSSGAWSGTFKFYINYQGGNANAETYEVDEESSTVLTYETIDNESSNLSLAMINLLGIHTVKADPINKEIDESKKKGTAIITGLKDDSITNITIADYYETENGDLYKIIGIKNYAFDGCDNLKEINFSGTKEEWENLDKGDDWNSNSGIDNITCSDKNLSVESEYYGLYIHNIYKSLNKLNIDVEKDYETNSEDRPCKIISNSAWSNCMTLRFPKSITKIGKCAFYYDNKLTTYELEDSKIESVGDYAFCNSSVNSFKAPNTLKSIGVGAFYGCSNLRSMNFLNTQLETIGENAFYYSNSISTIALPNTIKYIGSNAFSESSSYINFSGTKEEWENIEKASNWYSSKLKNIECSDGYIFL